jgi:hypothetical protein
MLTVVLQLNAARKLTNSNQSSNVYIHNNKKHNIQLLTSAEYCYTETPSEHANIQAFRNGGRKWHAVTSRTLATHWGSSRWFQGDTDATMLSATKRRRILLDIFTTTFNKHLSRYLPPGTCHLYCTANVTYERVWDGLSVWRKRKHSVYSERKAQTET